MQLPFRAVTCIAKNRPFLDDILLCQYFKVVEAQTEVNIALLITQGSPRRSGTQWREYSITYHTIRFKEEVPEVRSRSANGGAAQEAGGADEDEGGGGRREVAEKRVGGME